MLNLTRTRPTSITLHGEVITIQIARLSVGQSEDFNRRFQWLLACSERQKIEMEKVNGVDPTARVDEIMARVKAIGALNQPVGEPPDLLHQAAADLMFLLHQVRLLSPVPPMTEAEECAAKARQEREDTENSAFAVDAISAYVSVDPNQLAVGGVVVTTGEQLLAVLGDASRVAFDILMAIAKGQTVSELLRKVSASVSASAPSSDARVPAPGGPTLAPIAEPAAPADTTGSGAVTEATESKPSGSTGTSS